jgi:hypothetical protein
MNQLKHGIDKGSSNYSVVLRDKYELSAIQDQADFYSKSTLYCRINLLSTTDYRLQLHVVKFWSPGENGNAENFMNSSHAYKGASLTSIESSD